MGDSVTVTISNWDKFNPRKDYKRPWWFALSNRLMEDSEFYSFTDGEFRAWIYILSQASQHSSGTVHVSFEHANRVCNVRPKSLKSAIVKLKRIEAITIEEAEIRTESVQETNATEHNNTEHNRTIHNTPERRVFDFDLLYQKYPRHDGKSVGITKCRAQIKSQEDYDLLSTAIDRYVSHCKTEGTEKKFIKHFSSFMTAWRDWLDPKTGTGKSFEKKSGPDWDKLQRELGA